MINWLIQNTNDQPILPQAAVLPDWLSAAEQARYQSLKTAKRQQDWLLGRWTAKRLIQQVAAQQNGRSPALHHIQIDNNAAGAPVVNPQSAIINPPTLSISHSHGHAFCAVWPQADMAIGADIERITPRSNTFVRDYFTAAEIAHVSADRSQTMDYRLRDTLVTAVWSAKEAVLKVLQLGLTVDTRAVTCLPAMPGSTSDAWLPVEIQFDNTRLPRETAACRGWWRPWGDYVLTLAVQTVNS